MSSTDSTTFLPETDPAVAQPGQQESVTEIVDADGDVMLLVGEKAQKILVSSLFLTKASRVFSALLSDRYAEGSNKLDVSPIEIPLPHDDPTAVLLMCKLLHLQRHDLTTTLNSAELLELAITADKYDSTRQLHFAAFRWFQIASKPPHVIDALIELTAAAYLFEDVSHFKNFTQIIIFEKNVCMTQLLETRAMSFLPVHTPKLLDHQISTARDRLFRGLSFLTLSCPTTCAYRWDMNDKFKTDLQRQIWDLSPGGLAAVSIKAACVAVSSMNPSNWASTAKGCGNTVSHEGKPTKVGLDTVLEITRNTCSGLCLRCVREGKKITGDCSEHTV